MFEDDGITRWPQARRRSRHAGAGPRPLSRLLEDCARGILAAQRTEGGCHSCVALAERLGLSPAFTAEMVEQLVELGLVRWEAHGPLALTRTGQKVALEVLRHRRVLEAHLGCALTASPADVERTGRPLASLSSATDVC